MAEFLTRDEIRDHYGMVLNKPGYIKTLKKSITEAKVEQILNYAREVYMESTMRIEREDGQFHAVTPYRFPPCPLSTEIFVLPNGIKIDAFTYRDQLKYWLISSRRVIQIIEDNMKPGRKKLVLTQDLTLEDVLIDGESGEIVRSYYNFQMHSNTYLSKFLRILQQMGYFRRKLSGPEFQAIGRNDFNAPVYRDRNGYKPPPLDELYKYPLFRNIPRPERSKKL